MFTVFTMYFGISCRQNSCRGNILMAIAKHKQAGGCLQ